MHVALKTQAPQSKGGQKRLLRKMVSPDEALQLVLGETALLPTVLRPICEAIGCTLAEEVAADRDQPPFDRAMMDGYAVPDGAAGRTLPVVGQIPAGCEAMSHLREGRVAEIMTGAACPPGTYAVVPKEQVQTDENGATLPTKIVAGQHIATRGSEHGTGETVLRAGDRVDSLAVAALACFGKTSVRIFRSATVAIVTTGAEVVPPESVPGPAQIRDGNGPMLYTMARASGVERPILEHATDRTDAIVDCVSRHIECDVLVLTGGVSAGRYDLVPDALRQAGAEIVLHKVRQKPGKPLLFARRGKQLIFGLPGNPLASHFCFHRYVGAALRKLQGVNPYRPGIRAKLTEPVTPKPGRAYYVLGKLDLSDSVRGPTTHPLPGRSSADVFRAVAPDCYLEIPPGRETIPASEFVTVTTLDDAENGFGSYHFTKERRDQEETACQATP